MLDVIYPTIVDSLNRDSVDKIMSLRLYTSENTRNYLLENNILEYPDILVPEDLQPTYKRYNLLSESGEFILSNRFIIPIRNAKGNIITLVGWRKGKDKYITLPSDLFSKSALWFNIDRALQKSYESYLNGYKSSVVVVEGIFDALMLDSIGVPAVATMGYDVGRYKGELLKLFDKVLCLPDNDKVGRRAFKNWCVPSNSKFLFLESEVDLGDISLKLKDMDGIVNWYAPEEVRDLLLDVMNSNLKYVKLEI